MNAAHRYQKNIVSVFFLLTLLLSLPSITFGQVAKMKPVDQVSNQELLNYYKKAVASGITESEIEVAARAQGYTSEDIQKVRERLANLNEATNAVSGSGANGVSSGRTTEGTVDNRLINSNPKSDLSIFGAAIFNNKALNFEPNLRIPTPVNYILGPDDELVIDIFGEVLDNYRVKISPEGTIKLLNLSPIYINGLSIQAASEKIIGKLRQVYQGLNRPGSGSSAQITLGNVRSIKVTLTGEVSNPGSYTVSSLASAFNALYLAGGPGKNGSYRDIRVIRNNKIIQRIDVYDFILRGEQKNNITLHDQDILFIPEYKNRVSIEGEILRPGIFELSEDESLSDLIRFAGGFTDKAYTQSLTATRNTSKELKVLTISFGENSKFYPQNGDKFLIGEILSRYENRVILTGAVFRPGNYALGKEISSIRQLILKAEGLKENAFLKRALIKRKLESNQTEIISFDLGKLISGAGPDIALQKEDVIEIFNIEELKETYTVNLNGEVNAPGSFEYFEGLKLGDLILLGKGFKTSASFAKIEIARRVLDHGKSQDFSKNIELFEFTIDGNLSISDEVSQFKLFPFDVVSIRQAPNFQAQQLATVQGMAVYPGTYAIKDNTTIYDLIQMAGGLKAEGYLEGAKLYRNGNLIGVNIANAYKNLSRNDNLLILNGDRLEIPKLIQTVKVSGAVQNPLILNFDASHGLKKYLNATGGFTENAIKKKIYVTHVNGKSSRTAQFLFFKFHPKILPGDEIIVPAHPADLKKGISTGEVITIAGSLSSVTIALISLINILNR